MDIDGRKVAAEIRNKLRMEIEKNKLTPKLAFILVGNHEASKAYVRMKGKACKEVGIISERIDLSEDISEIDLLDRINEFNKDSSVHGILVQMPLSKQIDEQAVINAIDPTKDVDCFHPTNVGHMTNGSRAGFLPCTPSGIIELLKYYKIETSGKQVVILGRSNIVGRPVSILLSQNARGGNATVTVVHSRSKNLEAICKSADILVCAIGKPKFVTANMVKDGSVVIDVGITRTDEGLVGDVDFERVAPKCSHITPVPGGVGPMTIAMLLSNTVKACILSTLKDEGSS